MCKRSVLLIGAIAALSSACSGERKVAPAITDTVLAVASSVPGPSATPARSPENFRVRFETTKGAFVVQVKRSLAPRGTDRFHELVTIGYFTDVRFFRMVPGFVVQFGIHGDPGVNAMWDTAAIADDPIRSSNADGTIAFAANGPDSRATQLFISVANNARKLDGQRLFSPFGTVVEGMNVVRSLNAEYGEEPNPSRIVRQGNSYLQKWFPALDYIKSATIEP